MADPTGTLDLPTRAQIRDRYLRNYGVRNLNADLGPDTLPYADALAHADSVVPIYANAQVIGTATNLIGAVGTALDSIGEAEGVTRPPAAGASGYVTVTTSTGGATIFDGDELVYRPTSKRYKCIRTALYVTGDEVPVLAIDTGPSTNLDAAAELSWSSPRPGCASACVVAEQADGSGLTGGRDKAGDDAYAQLIVSNRANPKVAGNAAAYVSSVEATPAMSVQKGFAYPAIRGPGTTGIVFTMKPSSAGASRLPNATQIAQVEANLKATYPYDDGIFCATLLAQNVVVALEVSWTRRAAGYVDASPWPAYVTGPVAIDNAVAITATSFRLTTSTSMTDPQVGQTIGFWNGTTGSFSRKRILTVTVVSAGLSWDITCDTSNGATDASYTPTDGQLASPWSDSLDAVAAPVLAYFDGLGPGEQVASLPDPGYRMRRTPESPGEWPSEVRNRILDKVFDVDGVSDADLLTPTVPLTTTVGSAGATSYLIQLSDFAIFAA